MAENRITCTKCGTQLSGATIQQILEWDSTHRCPSPEAAEEAARRREAQRLVDEVAAGRHDQPHP